MSYTLGTAAKATGKSKATISRAIQSGKLSAVKDETTGEYKINPAELHRVFDPVSSTQAQNGGLKQSDTAAETGLLRVQLEQERQERQRERVQLEATIDDLRRRLDSEGEERRRLTALLTDQRARPSDVILTRPPETAPATETVKSPPTPQRKGWRRLFG